MGQGRDVEVDQKEIALAALKIVEGYAHAGVSRATDPEQCAKFLAVFGLPYRMGKSFVPFCDAGQGYAGLKAYADALKKPYTPETCVEVLKTLVSPFRQDCWYISPSCGITMEMEAQRGRFIKRGESKPLPGWLVLYNWSQGHTPQHIGMALDAERDILVDGEFNTSSASNTNGGAVAIRDRGYSCVIGYIRTY